MSTQLKPDFRVRIAGREVSPGGSDPLVRAVVDMDMDQPGVAVLTFAGAPQTKVELGDRLEIDLGWTGNRQRVFTGAIHGVEPTYPGIIIRGFGDEMRLTRSGRISQLFENQTYGQIVKAHAQEAGITTGSIEDGARVSRAYLHRQTRWEHCKSLARHVGFDLYATEEGKLTFARFARRAADHELRFGQDLLHASIRFGQPLSGATVVPESPASSAGDDTSSWLVKDPSPHSAIEGDAGVLVVSDPSLRTRDAAKLAARAIVEASKRAAMRGSVTLVGRADIRLGHAVELKDVKQVNVDGLYQVRSIAHALAGNAGFRTTLGLARMAP